MADQRDRIGDALRTYRIRAGLDQAGIARALGVSQSQVSRWESGRDRPRAANLAAIRALVWGRDEPVLAGLIQTVRLASGPLAVFDARLQPLSASRSLRQAGGAMARFGWVFQPDQNPAVTLLARRLCAGAEASSEVTGARICLPFSFEAKPWAARVRLALYRVGPEIYGLGELDFAPDPEADAVPGIDLIGAQDTRNPAARRDYRDMRPSY
ncbi:helix-turn-helix domain-containing protein [Pelagibacterium montanilacus]|uniref:helix-turn-helix domain-containing protein n=1 Tax=Pelagibacterium montanilacus TaxID=2185280 RepID=UPI000F8D3F7F|nr:helix-turn-helix transcriptional regulator [Pelagibacterium montanilacus]